MEMLLLALLLPLTALLQVPEGPPVPLAAAVVVAEQPLVKTVGDTVVFSPDALNIAEDAMLEDVLKAIPGMEVDGGTVTLYGRKVEKLLLGGRLYFGGDILTGLKNLQGDAIESIRAYERPSEFTRLSGVDDGEAEPVLDVKVKRKFMDAWKGRVQGGGAWPLRYLAAGNAGMITDTSHVGLVANFRNTASHSGITTTRLNRFGTGAEGDRDRREAGMDFSRRRKDMDLEAHAKYTGYDVSTRRQTFSETHYPASVSLSRTEAPSLGRSDALRGEAELTWRPSRRWTFLFKPYVNLSGTGNWGEPVSTTYSEEEVALNSVRQQTASFQRRAEGRLTFQATHRFDKKGRTASFRLHDNLVGATDRFFNDYRAETFKSGKTTLREQYILTPSSRNDFQAQASWNEPIGKGVHLQLLLQSRLLSHSIDRNFHSLEELLPESGWLAAGSLRLRDQLAALPADYASCRDGDLSSSGRYTGILLTGSASLRYVRRKVNLLAGVSLKPVWNRVRYSTTGVTDARFGSAQFYAAPNLTLRYNKSKTEYFSLLYRSSVSPPSPLSLIPVRSGTNPLAVRVGNPDLKASFTHRAEVHYNYSNPRKGSSLVVDGEAQLVENAFATSTEYIPETGGKTIRTCNIDGNWSARGSVSFNHRFKDTPLSLVNHLDVNYNNDAIYVYNSLLKEDERSVLRRLAVRERLELGARWRKVNLTIRGGGEYSLEHSLLYPALKRQPYALYGGVDALWSLPHRWRLAADYGFYAMRGSGFEEMDRDTHFLEASVSKGFLKGRLTLRLSGEDLLDQGRHQTSGFSASARRFHQYNGFGRRVLLQLIWRFPK